MSIDHTNTFYIFIQNKKKQLIIDTGKPILYKALERKDQFTLSKAFSQSRFTTAPVTFFDQSKIQYLLYYYYIQL